MAQPPIDELVQRWKQNPSPAATVALCDALRAAPRAPLIQQVGEIATQRHAGDVGVLVSVARMYMEASRFGDAQAVLVAAGKRAPRDGAVYRWLGEVLLRRGDAERAEKVIERAIQLGAKDPDVQLWLERARVFRPMQAKAGPRAVAEEVAQTAAEPMREWLDSDNTTDVRVRPAEPSDADDDGPTRAGPMPVSYQGEAQTAPTSFEPVPEQPRAPSPRPPRPPPGPYASPAARQPPGPMIPEPFAPVQSSRPPRPLDPPPQPFVAPAQPFASIPSADQAAPWAQASVRQPAPMVPPNSRLAPAAPFPREARNGSAPAPYLSPAALPGSFPIGSPPAPAPYRSASGRPLVPHPRDVLDALALSGVFEPPADRGAAAAAWADAIKGPRRKGAPTLVIGMVLFVAASVGTYFFYRNKRAEEHVQAEALLGTVEDQLYAGRPGALPDVEKQLAQALQLESRSPRAAIDWTRERAVVGLIKSGADLAFEDAMARAKEVGVPEDKYAFARVGSFLFQGDTAGAAAVLPRWDGPASGDPWYQMVAGATLERAGDARARDRYATATKLEPRLAVAQIAQARATTVDGDVQEGMRLARALRTSMPDRAEPVALVALAWGRDPNRESIPAPPEVDEVGKRSGELPSGLQFVPHAIAALRAFDKHNADEARANIVKGLAVADSPGAAVWLGTIALPIGDEALARKGALAALQLSAVYEPARALAARVALMGGRLDEALKATEDLEATSPEVAVVRAACAYERTDADGVVRALDAIPPGARKLPFLAALGVAADALSGRLQLDATKAMTMASDDAPWSDLEAMDVALVGGDLATADKIAASWGPDASSNALRALRLARLARYEGRLDAADTLSQTAMDHGTVTPRVLWERAYVLVAHGRAGEVGRLLGRYPLVLGPLATWLSVYATASAGSVEAAKGKTASLDPPAPTAPLEARVIAAAAFGAIKDKQHGTDYVKQTLATAGQHPDLVAAAIALGFRKVEHGRRPPTYVAP
jgi:tetratricopeptide (TPR) repeat protein